MLLALVRSCLCLCRYCAKGRSGPSLGHCSTRILMALVRALFLIKRGEDHCFVGRRVCLGSRCIETCEAALGRRWHLPSRLPISFLKILVPLLFSSFRHTKATRNAGFRALSYKRGRKRFWFGRRWCLGSRCIEKCEAALGRG